MKPFLGIDITSDPENTCINGDEFLSAAAPTGDAAPAPEYETDAATAAMPVPRGDLLRILRIISGIMTLAFVIFVVGVYLSPYAVLREYYRDAPWLFWLGGGITAAWLVLNIIDIILEGIREAAVKKEKEEALDRGVNDYGKEILGIPEDAENLDVIAFNYVIKDGAPLAVASGEDAMFAHFNCSMMAFSDDGNLYLASTEEKYAFPRASLKAIRRVDESIALPDWNKDTAPTVGIYKQFGMSVDNLDRITVPHYYILELEKNGEAWGIYFPLYELSVFEKLTGLKAE